MKSTGILVILCVFLTITILLGTVLFPQNSIRRGIKTVLLNPKYRELAAHIELSRAEKTLILQKNGENWHGSGTINAKLLDFPVENAKIAAFITELCAERFLHQMSARPSSYADYGVDDDTAIRVKVRGANGTIFTDLFFGSENFSARSVFLRTAKNIPVYQTTNTMQQFLSINAENWADMALFPAILGLTTKNSVRVVITVADTERVLVNTVSSAAHFDTAVERLFSTRAAKLIGFTATEPPVATITVESLLEKTVTVHMYQNGQNYAVVPNFLPYTLEISPWTYERVISIGVKPP